MICRIGSDRADCAKRRVDYLIPGDHLAVGLTDVGTVSREGDPQFDRDAMEQAAGRSLRTWQFSVIAALTLALVAVGMAAVTLLYGWCRCMRFSGRP